MYNETFTGNKIKYRCNSIVIFIIMSFVCIDSVICHFQDYFNSCETEQSVGGAKTEGPLEKHLTRNTWLVSHVFRVGARTHTRQSGEMIQ